MCGLFGFVSMDNKGPNIKRLELIARVTMRRGPDAFGFAWIDGKGVLRMFKKTGRIVDHLGLLAMASDARFLIGHCRYATHGAPSENVNNHPHPVDGGWLVHNGVVRNYDDLVYDRDLMPVTECDSEAIGMLIENGSGTHRKRCKSAVKECEGPLAILGLWNRPNRMIAIRSGNPLSIGFVNDGTRTYLGSLPDDLPGEIVNVADKSGIEFTAKGMSQFSLGSSPKNHHKGSVASTGCPSLFR